ncbi:MAG: DUF3488 and transglutaminase-like domain-containing protein [Acidobacteria bacterium]|nr:DUF3488 and transglutaminase-like domain-containing protein [Acidobacteriota bacterium]
MKFDTYFRVSSYAMIACGALALVVSGGMGVWLAFLMTGALVVSWALEGRGWQLSERAGLVIVLLSLPLFYLDWKIQSSDIFALEYGHLQSRLGALVHLTLFLSAVKLFQVKADRDWLFLYLISFFEVLLAAGLSISPVFLAVLGLYMFCALLSIICFELRKARRVVPYGESRLLVEHDAGSRWRQRRTGQRRTRELRRLLVAAACLLTLIFVFALPIFFLTPRASESALAMAGGSASTGYVGFSDRMTLGDIGRLQRSNELVMRVRVENPQAARNRNLRWRGVALDNFNGRAWSRSSDEVESLLGDQRNFFPLGKTEDLSRLTTQTFFVEPIDTPVLFVAPRAVALQGAMPFVRRDGGDGLASRAHPQERITYRAYSDMVEPSPAELRADRQPYPLDETPNLRLPIDDYLQLPSGLDSRIAGLARQVINRAGARNRYDMARVIETHLGANAYGGEYSYSLEMKAAGPDPLADFLFRIRAGHCEYFSSAMAIMLRTQGIAARVVNGFQRGEYNGAADAYTVRQADAHSWVEVYFPETDAWVTFDPTPTAGRPNGATVPGLRGQLQKYGEALELLWIQYVVTYDKQEQRTLARTLRSRLGSYRAQAAQTATGLKSWLSALWNNAPGSLGNTGQTGLNALTPFLLASALLLLLPVFYLLYRRGFGFRRRARGVYEMRESAPVVRFYERMMKALEMRGLRRAGHQTPLEFALATDMPEALTITEAYNRVRYGERQLSREEVACVEDCLRRIEEKTEA